VRRRLSHRQVTWPDVAEFPVGYPGLSLGTAIGPTLAS